jgi:hypothetical protein
VSDEQGYPAGCAKCAEWATEVKSWQHIARLRTAELAREQERSKALETALREILADHDERVALYQFDVQPNRLRVMALARAALEQSK